MNKLPYTQYDFELAQADVLIYGDHKTIAEFHGTSPGLHDQQLSPNDERKSNLWRAICDIVGVATKSPERANKLLALFNLYVDRGMVAVDPNPKSFNLEEQAGCVASEFGEFVAARFSGKPIPVQISELDDVIREANKLRDGLVEKI